MSAEPPVQRLDVPVALLAGLDGVALLRGVLRGEADQVVHPASAAERATHARERPRAAADVAGEPAAAVLGEIGESRRRAAEWAHAEVPGAVGDVRATLGEEGVERRAQAGHREEP